jgi:hypothetical protein
MNGEAFKLDDCLFYLNVDALNCDDGSPKLQDWPLNLNDGVFNLNDRPSNLQYWSPKLNDDISKLKAGTCNLTDRPSNPVHRPSNWMLILQKIKVKPLCY